MGHKHAIKKCSCGKVISQCRCPGPRVDGKPQPKPVEVIQKGCSSCKGLKSIAPGDAVVLADAESFRAEQERAEAAKKAKFDTFIGKVKELGIYPDTAVYSRGKTEKCDPYVTVRWTTGGVGGGSCWDTGTEDNHHPISGEPEPEFDAVDKIIVELAPQIGFVQYKRLCMECIERGSDTSNDYYGNYTSYGVKTLRIKKLYDFLVEQGLYKP